jgi:hypothetical protein
MTVYENIQMSLDIKTALVREFDDFNDFDVAIESDEEVQGTYFCEVWAYSEDNTINDICVYAQDVTSEGILNSIILALYRKMTANRKIA